MRKYLHSRKFSWSLITLVSSLPSFCPAWDSSSFHSLISLLFFNVFVPATFISGRETDKTLSLNLLLSSAGILPLERVPEGCWSDKETVECVGETVAGLPVGVTDRRSEAENVLLLEIVTLLRGGDNWSGSEFVEFETGASLSKWLLTDKRLPSENVLPYDVKALVRGGDECSGVGELESCASFCIKWLLADRWLPCENVLPLDAATLVRGGDDCSGKGVLELGTGASLVKWLLADACLASENSFPLDNVTLVRGGDDCSGKTNLEADNISFRLDLGDNCTAKSDCRCINCSLCLRNIFSSKFLSFWIIFSSFFSVAESTAFRKSKVFALFFDSKRSSLLGFILTCQRWWGWLNYTATVVNQNTQLYLASYYTQIIRALWRKMSKKMTNNGLRL